MVPPGKPNNASTGDPQIHAEALEQMGAKRGEKLKKRTPEAAQEELSSVEKDTLQYFREKDTGFWKRAAKYKKFIEQRATEEAKNGIEIKDIKTGTGEKIEGVLDQMKSLGLSTSEKLRWYSRKSADRFTEVTSRINVASRTLSAVKKHRQLLVVDQKDINDGDGGMAQQIQSDYPWVGRVKLVREFLVPKSDTRLEEVKAMDYKKLEEAARDVRTKAIADRTKWEEKVNKRLAGVRKTENSLRSVILRHNKGMVDDIEQQLRDCAAGHTDDITQTINDLQPNGLDGAELAKLKNRLLSWVKLLSGKSGQLSKSFEVAGRVELTGTVAEVVTQVRSMPLGTRLLVVVPGINGGGTQEMILDSKSPQDYLIFKFVGKNSRMAVDTKQNAAWRYSTTKAPIVKTAEDAAKEIARLAKAASISATISSEIQKAVKNAILEKNASLTKVHAAVLAIATAHTLGKPETDLLRTAVKSEIRDKRVLPVGRRNDKAKPKRTEPIAREINFHQLRFQYPEYTSVPTSTPNFRP